MSDNSQHTGLLSTLCGAKIVWTDRFCGTLSLSQLRNKTTTNSRTYAEWFWCQRLTNKWWEFWLIKLTLFSICLQTQNWPKSFSSQLEACDCRTWDPLYMYQPLYFHNRYINRSVNLLTCLTTLLVFLMSVYPTQNCYLEWSVYFASINVTFPYLTVMSVTTADLDKGIRFTA